jgi:hypothetical protein
LLITFPLNVFPLGSATFVLLNSWAFTWMIQTIYFTHKGLDTKMQLKWTGAHFVEYVLFGVPSVVMQILPIVNVPLFFTTVVGCALWAVEMERDRTFLKVVRGRAQEMYVEMGEMGSTDISEDSTEMEDIPPLSIIPRSSLESTLPVPISQIISGDPEKPNDTTNQYPEPEPLPTIEIDLSPEVPLLDE